MRTIRILPAALSLVLLAACTAEPVGIAQPDAEPSLNGSSGSVEAESATGSERCGAGFCGSGN